MTDIYLTISFRLLIFLNLLYMFRATNSPILRNTFWLYLQLLVQYIDIAADRWQGHRSAAKSEHCTKAVYTVKSAHEDGRVCRPKHVEQIEMDQ